MTQQDIRISEREYEVLQLISMGYYTKHIAQELFISHNTVKTHKKHLFVKLDVFNAPFLVRRAFEYGFIQL